MPTVAGLDPQTSAAATDILLLADPTTGAAKKITVGNLTSFSKDTATYSGDDSYAVGAGSYVKRVLLKPTTSLTAFKLGTTVSGDELVGEQAVASGAWTVFNIDYYFECSGTMYFQGVTSSTSIIVYYE